MPRDAQRSRSRSPARSSHHHRRSERSRSPAGHKRRHHHHRHHSRRDHGSRQDKTDTAANRRQQQPPAEPPLPIILPYKATKLSKHDLETYRPLFASYLDIQKNKDIFELEDDEIRGRWKSFLGKWNRGELPEGWYDPEMKAKADASFAEDAEYAAAQQQQKYTANDQPQRSPQNNPGASDSSDEEAYGPSAPRLLNNSRSRGPAIPTFADLAERNDQRAADARAARTATRLAQKQHAAETRPERAEPGTRERALEKKRETAAAHRAFADARAAPGDMADVHEGELMGGGDAGQRAAETRRRTEREVRREEALLARRAEREEKIADLRAKEEGTMEMLRAMARQRYGGGA